MAKLIQWYPNSIDNANGRATGIASLAHLVMYKINTGSHSETDIVAIREAAVYDGLDVISISLNCLGINFF